MTAPGSLVTSFAHDAAGNPTGQTFSDGVTHSVAVTYDRAGRRAMKRDMNWR